MMHATCQDIAEYCMLVEVSLSQFNYRASCHIRNPQMLLFSFFHYRTCAHVYRSRGLCFFLPRSCAVAKEATQKCHVNIMAVSPPQSTRAQ